MIIEDCFHNKGTHYQLLQLQLQLCTMITIMPYQILIFMTKIPVKLSTPGSVSQKYFLEILLLLLPQKLINKKNHLEILILQLPQRQMHENYCLAL